MVKTLFWDGGTFEIKPKEALKIGDFLRHIKPLIYYKNESDITSSVLCLCSEQVVDYKQVNLIYILTDTAKQWFYVGFKGNGTFLTLIILGCTTDEKWSEHCWDKFRDL